MRYNLKIKRNLEASNKSMEHDDEITNAINVNTQSRNYLYNKEDRSESIIQ